MEWRKFYTRKWLYGSIRLARPDIRGTFADLMALAGESKLGDGTLRHDIGRPMAREWIANVLMIPLELLNETIDDGQNDKNVKDDRSRIVVWDDGTIEITNFTEYQSDANTKKKPPDKSEESKDKMALRRAVQKPELAHKAEEINGNQVIGKGGEILNSLSEKEKQFGQICQVYEANIGILTPMVSDELKAICDGYPFEWFGEAVQEACKSNVRKLSYVTRILENWKTEGKYSPNGHKQDKKPLGLTTGDEVEKIKAIRKAYKDGQESGDMSKYFELSRQQNKGA